jgi:hypothetical protein
MLALGICYPNSMANIVWQRHWGQIANHINSHHLGKQKLVDMCTV